LTVYSVLLDYFLIQPHILFYRISLYSEKIHFKDLFIRL